MDSDDREKAAIRAALIERMKDLEPIDYALLFGDGWVLVADQVCRYWLAPSDLPVFLDAWDNEYPSPKVVDNGCLVDSGDDRYESACLYVSWLTDDDVPLDVIQQARDWFAVNANPIVGCVSYGF